MKDTNTSRETKPLTGRYAKLRDDLKIALAAGQEAAAAYDTDEGTCNFDAAALILPRWNRKLLKQAAEEAGTVCSEWSGWIKSAYVFHPRVRAQGNPRSAAAEAMTEKLKELGYDALTYYQMD